MTQSAAAPVAPPSISSAPKPVKPPSAADETNVKETIESILVAFILAFIFRAFVVEAFVIPTGSMAPTLLGAHMRFACTDCGYRFTVNFSGRTNGDDVVVPSFVEKVPEITERVGPDGRVRRGTELKDKVLPLFCPNCGYKVPRVLPNDPDNDATAPPVFYGDRILVMKYLYLLQEPQRWDVVVFKSPDLPDQFDYQQNFIKRLVGKPGEALMVLDGDVYTADSKPADQLKPTDFHVQRKPRHVQDALWRIVYDNGYHPQGIARSGEPPFVQPWRVVDGGGWSLPAALPAARTFVFGGDAGTIEFDPAANPPTNALTDWLAYDMLVDTERFAHLADLYDKDRRGWREWTNVRDVKLDLHYARKDGSGPLRLSVTKLSDTFVAELLPDRVRLLRTTAGGPEREVASRPFVWPAGRAVHVEFQNLDYQVSLIVDGQPLLQTDDDYQPDVGYLIEAFRAHAQLPKPTIRVEARQQACELTHVGLYRDVHYTNNADGQGLRWGTPTSPVVLGPDEFFVCGDNSIVSKDSRYWDKPIDLPDEGLQVEAGRVPRRFMLGKAFFVYWPAGYRPTSGSPGLVPNFGEMRFIH